MAAGQIDKFNKAREIGMAHVMTILADLYPAGKFHGREFKLGGLDGSPGESFSFNVDKGIGKDFNGGNPVDIIGMWAARRGIRDNEAAEEIIKQYGNAPAEPQKRQQKEKPHDSLRVVPADAPTPPDIWKGNRVSFRWEYRDAAGRLAGYACRFDLPTEPGKKQNKAVIPQSFSASRGWDWIRMAEPQPLFGAELLAACDGWEIAIVEGEKTAVAARELLGGCGYLVLTFQGGGSAWQKSDWSVLQGRKVLIIPDNDDAGRKCSRQIADHLLQNKICPFVRIADLPPELPPAWDLADQPPPETNMTEILDCILQRSRPEPEERKGSNHRAPLQLYRAIGRTAKEFYFLDSGGYVCSFSAVGLTSPGNLISIQPNRTFWKTKYDGEGGLVAANCLEVAEKLVNECESAGEFDPERVRGVGVWEDAGRTVIHAGDQLCVDGVDTRFMDFKSSYFYEKGLPITYTTEQPDISIPRHFRKLCESLSWESPISGLLLAGWCIIAPLAGVLPWRPHIWLTAPPGGGKTWVINHIVKPALGDIAKMVQGATTEAGLRQELRSDARPIIFDEAESEDDRASQIMQNVLQLVRQSSSGEGGKIVKGSASGQAVKFTAKSIYMFASIGVTLKHKADTDRVTILAMRRNTEDERIKFSNEIKPMAKALMTEKNCLQLRSFAIANALKIREATRVFSDAVAEHLGSTRHGDQLGALLAGAAILRGQEVDMGIYQSVLEWVRKQDWSGHADNPNEGDEIKLLAKIQQHMVKVKNGKDRDVDCNIAGLVQIANGKDPDFVNDFTMQANAVRALSLRGIKLHNKDGASYVAISNMHNGMADVLAGSAWAASWRITLARLPGVVTNVSLRMVGNCAKFVLVPMAVWDGKNSEGVDK